MNTLTKDETTTLATRATGEILALMGRERLSQRALAMKLDKPQQWLSRRLNHEVPITLDDLEAIGRALEVEPMSLLIDWRARRDSNSQPSDPKSDAKSRDRPPLTLIKGGSSPRVQVPDQRVTRME